MDVGKDDAGCWRTKSVEILNTPTMVCRAFVIRVILLAST